MTIEMKMDQRYEQGKNEGIQLGRSEGEISKERELITKWLQKGKTITEIAEDLDQSEEYVKSLKIQLDCTNLREMRAETGGKL